MKGWQIFTHSVRQVTGNIGPAFRISGVLYVVQIAVTLLLLRAMAPYGSAEAAGAASGAFVGKALVAGLIVIVTALWIAVAWHRYVLREEASKGPLPPFRGDRMLAYLGMGLLVGLILIIPAMAAGAALGALAWSLAGPANLVVSLILQAVLQTLLGAFAFRLSTVLPGVALEPGHKIREGWDATAGEMGAFFALSFYCAVALLLIGLISLALQRFGLAGLGWEVVAQWTVTMVGVSILTTLYGHYIEKRPLV